MNMDMAKRMRKKYIIWALLSSKLYIICKTWPETKTLKQNKFVSVYLYNRSILCIMIINWILIEL